MSKVIAIDIDDVLSQSAAKVIEYGNQNWGHRFTLADFASEVDWKNLWGHEPETEQKRRTELRESGHYRKFAPHPNALEVLTELKKSYRLVVVTAREELLVDITNDWLAQHFGGLFDDVRYAGIWDPEAENYLTTKLELCQNIGVDFLIDDQLRHCLEAAKCGMTCLLFGDYPWNQSRQQLPHNVVRCLDWKAVGEYFNGLNA